MPVGRAAIHLRVMHRRSSHVLGLLAIALALVAVPRRADSAFVQSQTFSGAVNGIAWGDYDTDGDPDLYLVGFGIPSRLLRNDGGTFVNVSAAPLNISGLGSSAAWADFDNDGRLDLAAGSDVGVRLFRNNGGSFTDVTAGALLGVFEVYGIGWADYDRDGDVDLCLANVGASKLFRNDAGVFVDVTPPALAVPASGVAWGDFDADRWPDLFLNDGHTSGGGSSKLFRNSAGTLADVTASPVNNPGGRGYDAEWADYDNDGDLDLLVGNRNTGSVTSRLLRNLDGVGSFSDVTVGSGIVANQYGQAWGDYDNDGDEDLYALHSTGNRLWRNNNNGTFTDVTGGAPLNAAYLEGVAWADIDADGDLDLAVATAGASPTLILRNDGSTGSNRWLHVDLVGTNSNRFGIGARVRVRAGGVERIREISGSAGFLGQNSLTAEFGMGLADVDSLIVDWPSGLRQVVTPPASNQRVTVTEQAPFSITTSAGANGAIAPSGVVAVPAGGSVTFTITPDPGFDIADVLVDGQSVGVVEAFPFSGVVANHTIEATFEVSPPVDSSPWLTNGVVYATVVDSGRLYIGGSFDRIGRYSGAGVAVHPVSGARRLTSPAIYGAVLASAPDGDGGWFIGGAFDSVGALPRQNLAHITAELTVSSWNPGADGQVATLAVKDGVVYVGGFFNVLGGASRSRIGAVGSASGTVTDWNPSANGSVRTVVPSGDRIFVGGFFSNIGGASRNRLATLHAVTGQALGWNPNAGGLVRTLALSGSTVYLGGDFGLIGGQSRLFLAAVDTAGGVPTSWTPSMSSRVHALAVRSGKIYAGGAESKIAMLDSVTGARTDIASIEGTAVNCLVFDGPRLRIGGAFTRTLSGSFGPPVNTRLGAASIGLCPNEDLECVDDWNPSLGGEVFTISVGPTSTYVGGFFDIAGAIERYSLAAFDLGTGEPTGWTVPTSDVRALVAAHDRIYVGGWFPELSVNSSQGVMAVDYSGNVLPWNPDLGDSFLVRVNDIAVSGDTVYVGGEFDSAGGQLRSNLAALDATSALPLTWNPAADGRVWALSSGSGRLYLGGDFENVGGQPRQRIASIDASGAVTGWDPSADSTVYAIAVSGTDVFLGGTFAHAGGEDRARIARLDAASGAASPDWNPGATSAGLSHVYALGVRGASLFVGGTFDAIGAQSRSKLAEVGVSTGAVSDWHPNLDNTVFALTTGPTEVHVGGGFFRVDGVPRGGFATISAPPGLTDVTDDPPGAQITLGFGIAPNPAQGLSTLSFVLPKPSSVTISIFDVSGRLVKSLARNRWLPAGPNSMALESRDLPGGLYLVRFRTTGLEISRKLLVIH